MLEIGYVTKAYGNRVASNRYRIGIPCVKMRELGVNAGFGPGLINIVEKSTHSFREQLENSKKKGHKILLDFCDLHTDVGHFEHEHYADLADGIVCNTPALMEGVKQRYPKFTGQYFVIEDPVEYPEGEVGFPGGGQRLLWYGHCSHIPAIKELIPKLTGLLHVITNNVDPSHYWSRNSTWSQETVLNGLEWADIVLLPSSQPDFKNWPIAEYKGANRLVEAVRRGRYAINDGRVPAYRDYGMWCGDIPEGLKWVRKNPEEALDQVRKAQSIVRARNHPDVIARKWLEACNAVGGKLWHWTERMRD
jgi:hypothetical protein